MRIFQEIPLTKFAVLPLIVISLFGGACTGIPSGIRPVTGLDTARYLGTWYEIARLDHRFERGLENVTAKYSMRPDGGIKVQNSGYDQIKKEWREATGRAYAIDDPTVGRLKVSFFGPFFGAYNIVELDDKGYQYSMVIGPSLSYFWILSRSPTMSDELLRTLLKRAAEYGIDTHKLIFPKHNTDAQ